MPRWNGARTKIQLKLAIQRARMLQEKKESLAKQARREIADLVQRGKMETAHVKTESLIMEDVHIELLELLELYCETLHARFALLELNTTEPEDAVKEPLMGLLHAAHRTELPELHVLRDMLAARYGAELAQAALDNADECVSPRVTKKLAFHMPPEELVHAYLSETYEVPFGDDVETGTEVVQGGNEGATATDAADAPEKAAPSAPADTSPPAAAAPSEWDALMNRFAALKKRS